MNRVKVALGMTVEAARQCAKIGKSEEPFVKLNEFHADIFTWLCVLLDSPPVLYWISHG